MVFQYYFRSIGVGRENFGISFGMWQGVGVWMIGLVLLVLCGYVLSLLKNDKKIGRGLCFVLIGGLVNLMMRVWWGSVWDYISISFLPFVFNLSDVLITVGVVATFFKRNGG